MTPLTSTSPSTSNEQATKAVPATDTLKPQHLKWLYIIVSRIVTPFMPINNMGLADEDLSKQDPIVQSMSRVDILRERTKADYPDAPPMQEHVMSPHATDTPKPQRPSPYGPRSTVIRLDKSDCDTLHANK
jgi:hypothetical protein